MLLGVEAAEPQLIFDRCVALIVGRVAGVKCDLHDASLVRETVTLPAVRFGLDEITRSLPGEQPHQIDKARIRLGCDERNRGFRYRIDDHAKLFGCRSSLSRHRRVLAIGRIAPHLGKDDELLSQDKAKHLIGSMSCIAFAR
ncbi:hypothetical protein NLM33_24965 [Bradyrhizobium sp. CCGUVB1N3]|uniref:hypothetical protein n=1 Tax=Bradyrhizobium sp. CCGUVB1N3 TaxID=2949629 RepID=UPI0020B36E58|nr:hypothetical protein [Bradyrhizobium sp. CCGUVB1N3]MCP3473570.1 hypothetical protein [Bradyrhizobium sp. CCGUVB1N3]